jgi:hypothetical protein
LYVKTGDEARFFCEAFVGAYTHRIHQFWFHVCMWSYDASCCSLLCPWPLLIDTVRNSYYAPGR